MSEWETFEEFLKEEEQECLMKIIRLWGTKIKDLDSAPPHILMAVFSSGTWKTGDMIADESGQIWTFIDAGDCSILHGGDRVIQF
jgi:hypothetical protein